MPDNLKLDIFDTETSEWHSIANIQRFRHVAWLFQGQIFIQGGFEQENPSLPVSDVHRIDLMKGLASKPQLINKIKAFIQTATSPTNSSPNTPSLTPEISPSRTAVGRPVSQPVQNQPKQAPVQNMQAFNNYANNTMMMQ